MLTSYFNTNTIFCGDNEIVLSKFPDECVDLIYADPPFFSNQQYEILWGDGYEIRAFEDRWKGGINNYLEWMVPKIEQCYRVLKESGSMYLHCDWHASHHLRAVMERVFSENNFRSEIIWQRTSAHNDPKNFGNVTDSILYFVKSDSYTWNPQYAPFSQEYIDTWYRNKDNDGRRYMSDNLASPHPRPNLTYDYKGFKPPAYGWKVSLEVMKKLDEEGRLIFPKRNTGVIRRKMFLDSSKGRSLQNLWSDIPPIHSQSKERLGYPTQKPEKLLERIINASSNAMDVILDPFCGCGTAIFAAQKLGRRWVGIDISPTACDLMEKRMRRLHISPIVMGMPLTEDDLRKVAPFEFQNWVVRRLYGRVTARKSGDMGIDGMTFEGIPIQVKQSDDIGRNIIDNFETALRRRKKGKGIVVAFSFGRGAYEEIARAKLNDNLDIQPLQIKELLKKQEQQTTL